MKLTVHRKTAGPDLLRPYRVFLDDHISKKLYNNNSVTFDVDELNIKGIYIKIDWIKSKRFSLNEFKDNDELKLQVYVHPVFNLCIFLMVGSVLLWDISHYHIFSWVAILAFVIIIYFYTIGRNNYFKIKLIT